MKKKDRYFKQKKLYNPEEQQPKITVYGCGSIGSHVTIGLMKTGFKEITIIDYDKVEPSNTPAQFYKHKSKGQKTQKLRQLAEEMCGQKPTAINQKIDKKWTPRPETIKGIHVLALDNIETRKIINKKLKGYPAHIIDGRIGAFNWEIYYHKANKIPKEYLKSLEGKFTELQCGEKTLWAVNTQIASKIISNIIKITKGHTPFEISKGNLMSNTIITKVK